MASEGPGSAVGVPSASAAVRGHHHAAAYNLFTVERDGDGWRCGHRVRGFAADGMLGEIKNERLV